MKDDFIVKVNFLQSHIVSRLNFLNKEPPLYMEYMEPFLYGNFSAGDRLRHFLPSKQEISAMWRSLKEDQLNNAIRREASKKKTFFSGRRPKQGTPITPCI